MCDVFTLTSSGSRPCSSFDRPARPLNGRQVRVISQVFRNARRHLGLRGSARLQPGQHLRGASPSFFDGYHVLHLRRSGQPPDHAILAARRETITFRPHVVSLYGGWYGSPRIWQAVVIASFRA